MNKTQKCRGCKAVDEREANMWMQKQEEKARGASRVGLACLPCPALHHPPDRKVMHESTKQNCIGESASSHLESFRCLNKPERDVSVAEESLVPGEPGLDACSICCPRHWKPWFGVHCAGSMHALSPSLNFRCLRMKKVHSAKAFRKKMPWGYISVWLFTSREAYTMLTHTHAHT